MKAELTHDIIARKVGEKVSAEDKKLRRVEKFIHDSMETFQIRGANAYLSKDDVEYIQPFLDKVFLSEEDKDFLEKSKENITLKRKKLIRIVAGLSLLIVLLSSGSYFSSKMAEKENENLEKNKKINEIKKEENEEKKSELEKTILELKEQEEELLIKKEKIEAVKRKQEEIAKDSELKKEENRKVKQEQESIVAQSEMVQKESAKQKKELEEQEKQFSVKLNNISEKLSEIQKQEDDREAGVLKSAIEGKEWSKSIGEARWDTAVKKCEQLDRAGGSAWRLPTVLEYKGMYKYKHETIEQWKSEGTYYWTRDIFSDGSAYYFNISSGGSGDDHKDGNEHVRCIR